jgi:hypothetical protein
LNYKSEQEIREVRDAFDKILNAYLRLLSFLTKTQSERDWKVKAGTCVGEKSLKYYD